MPTEIVLRREQLGLELVWMGLQPRPGLRQPRFQRGEGQAKIPLDCPIIGDQLVGKPGHANLDKLVTPIGSGSKVRRITRYFATDPHEIVRCDGIVTRYVVGSTVGNGCTDQGDKCRHEIVDEEKVNTKFCSRTQKDGHRRAQPREDEGSLRGVERSEDTLRPDNRHWPSFSMPMLDQDIFDGCLIATVRARGGRSRSGFRVRRGHRDPIDARRAAEYVVPDAGSMTRRQERQDVSWGVPADITDDVKPLVEPCSFKTCAANGR